MSKEKTPDDKLREAALNILPKNISGGRRNEPPTVDINEYWREMMVAFAKSKEAAEYHQSLQPVVDISKLWGEFIDFVWFENNNTSAGKIFDFFKPHLQPPAPESDIVDPVDFAEWILENCSFTDSEEGPRQWFLYGPDVPVTSKNLYTKYKQSKTNSDE